MRGGLVDVAATGLRRFATGDAYVDRLMLQLLTTEQVLLPTGSGNRGFSRAAGRELRAAVQNVLASDAGEGCRKAADAAVRATMVCVMVKEQQGAAVVEGCGHEQIAEKAVG